MSTGRDETRQRTGWHTSVRFGERTAPTGAIGVVVSQNFPDEKLLKETLRQGIARKGSKVVWVMLNEPKTNHAARWAAEVFEEFEIDPLYAPLVPYWQAKREEHGYDFRSDMRESELRATCERIVVFHDVNSASTATWFNYSPVDGPYEDGKTPCRAKISVVSAGKPKKKKRPGRKPSGA